MRVRIMHNHPIAALSAPVCFDNRVHEFTGNPLDLTSLGEWLTRRTGIRFNYRAGFSRVEKGRCIYFPARYDYGVHCMWIEEMLDVQA